MSFHKNLEIGIRQIRVTVSDIQDFLGELRAIGKRHKCVFICFNRDVMAGAAHVRSAVSHAERAFKEGINISRGLEVESLLYGAGTRQTGLIGPFGIHLGLNECFLCVLPAKSDVYNVLPENVEYADDEDWEIIGPEKEWRLCELFEITSVELGITGRDRIQELVLERVALLVVNR